MDIAILGGESLRVKGRTSSILIDPVSSIPKTEAEGIVLLKKSPSFSEAKVEGSRITIKGPGEYEVGGLKISAASANGGLVAKFDVDDVKVLVGSGSSIEKFHDKVEECEIAVVNADSEFNYSVLAALEPKVLIVYGEKKEDVQKSLGKDTAVKSSKYSITKEKLPEEMDFVLFE